MNDLAALVGAQEAPVANARVVQEEGCLMELTVSLEADPSQKRLIQQYLTALLPEWFGQPEAIVLGWESIRVATVPVSGEHLLTPHVKACGRITCSSCSSQPFIQVLRMNGISTRLFHEAMGFQFVLEEQFPREATPLAYYMKQLG